VQSRIHRVRLPYAASSYNDDLCLKPPLLLWLAMAYLSRAITLPVVMGICTFARVDSHVLALFRQFWSSETLIPSLIASIVLFALFRRVPGASQPLRWIWARGRTLLALSAGIDLAMSLVLPIRQREIDQQVLVSLCAAGIDAYFLLYILVARRVRDTFADFPPPLNATTSAL
jgi:hypothetical protein